MKKQYLFGLLLSLLSAAPVFAQTPEERGLEIAQEADKRDMGWQDMKSNMLMILRNRHGQESKREIRLRSLEILDDGDKSLSIFDHPRDVKGTAFLSFTHATTPDDQWLYLPALKRVKRISSKNKSGPFMGSEFAFEDLTSQEVERYTYKWLRDEDLDGRAMFVVERYPEYAHSGYKRQIVWVDQEYWQPQKIEFYDRKNSLLKTLVYEGYQQYLDQYWRPAKMHMDNHQTGKSTTLEWNDYEFKTGLTDRDFDKNSLKRAR
ncbi:outer membrane lipoprotein-sorting protein [Candidatus Albibeggiatoa sp. nov. NOAA]|uniref:outer membrane lipoprotein-sorting protein n=1 Tax=Candidatus Albibeggiatoa sp. nov. NOAA TaxID=3162724 RepID=UPI0032F1F0A4|nr:outer membrane lipoprotein-sorting protein [Thiotrichaceae bacterium]